MEKEVELVKTLKEATETRSLWTVVLPQVNDSRCQTA